MENCKAMQVVDREHIIYSTFEKFYFNVKFIVRFNVKFIVLISALATLLLWKHNIMLNIKRDT